MGAPKGHAPYPGCEKGGRPVEWTEKRLSALADRLEEWMKKKENIIIEDFCLENYIYDSDMAYFSKRSEKFSSTYKRFKMKQKSAIMKGGLTKKFSYPACYLMLNQNHGVVLKDNVEHTHTITNLSDLKKSFESGDVCQT